MSKTKDYSSLMLQINRKSERYNLSFAFLKMLMGIDANGGKEVMRRDIETSTGSAISAKLIQNLRERRLITVRNISTDERKKINGYSLTEEAEIILSVVLGGKA